jgi:transcription antitermination factor NusG
MNHWAVAQTQPRLEWLVKTIFEICGREHVAEVYLPRVKVKKRIVPLFPGYVFLRLKDRWYPIVNSPGVARLLMSGDKPAKLDDSIIIELRRRERNGVVKLAQPPRLRPGQRVKVVRGSFDGQVGLYEGMRGADRERVLLELLGRQVRIELASADVAPLDLVASPNSMRY